MAGNIYSLFEKPKSLTDFKGIKINLCSPAKIRAMSHGEVKKPETINYRTFKPERDGLFCAKIFGPVKDWECLCGKYKRMKHRGVVCDKCGVEVIRSNVRRERLAHIELASPVAHIWFLKGVPSRIGTLLDMTMSHLEKVLYFENFLVVDPGDTPLKERELLTDEKYREALQTYGDHFKAGMGADAVRELLRKVDCGKLAVELREDMHKATSMGAKRKLAKRLKVVDAFKHSGNKPEWMIMDVIPVLPPDLRPLVPLEGGRFATSDLNDLYRRVINRNNRLKRLMDLKAPSVIIRNEKRMLQESVDSLFDNGRRTKVLKAATKRSLKSLSDMIKGKQGRFRQNLLGKRVDYSGRSVVVVGPELKLHQCGLPKKMALELFKPFVYNVLEEKGFATTIKAAKRIVEKEESEVWDALDEVIADHPVLLNRAPTLHRLGIQAFDPVLVEGKAIRLHPLVCTAFNADFDGDQMAVHVPLSIEAQIEARVLMMSVGNILSPANGRPIDVPTQDMVLGIYYLTKEKKGCKGEGMIFSGPTEARIAHETGEADLQAAVQVRVNGQRVQSTVGRIIFGEVLPPEIPFETVNMLMNKKELAKLVDVCYREAGPRATVKLLDKIERAGFKYATRSGVSICIDDMHVPKSKSRLIKEAEGEVQEVTNQYSDGLITNGERYNKIIDIWAKVTETVAEEMMLNLGAEGQEEMNLSKEELLERREFNSIFMMADSGARGSAAQIRQLAGMRGLMAKPSGEIIETPITANFREGLSTLQYFISTHGARKGLADTALKTANSGYLTRRLVDVAQDMIISEEDCKTKEGIEVIALIEGGEIVEPLEDRLYGRVTLTDIKDPVTDEVIVKKNALLDDAIAHKVVEAGVEKVKIRSVLTCRSRRGTCIKCYGRDMAKGGTVGIGEAVGIIAAQSIGEPGTQLTMRTFHIGGTASKVVAQTALESKHNGHVQFIDLQTVRDRDGVLVAMNRHGSVAVVDAKGREKEKYAVVYGARLKVEEGDKVKVGQRLVEWDPYSIPIIAEAAGRIALGDIVDGVTVKEETDELTGLVRKLVIEYPADRQPRISLKDEHGKTTLKLSGTKQPARYMLPAGSHLLVDRGAHVLPGDILAKIPRETTKTKDITGGLPRVAELFEARKPKDAAVISEIDGIVEVGGFVKGQRKVSVRGGNDIREYLIPKGKHLAIQHDDWVRAGEPLMDGAVNPHSVLDILGPQELQKYIVNEVQKVYRLQGVTINDKHIEVIVRQMMRKVRVDDPGSTMLLAGEQVDRFAFEEENAKVKAEGGKAAVGKPLLLGITKASLTTDSFISAASFQETTRVLTEAAISGSVDWLLGLKENVIMGRLIPSGTGLDMYRETFVRRGNNNKLSEVKPEPDNLKQEG